MIPEGVKQFVIEESIAVEGITDEYVWYHAKLLSAKMNAWDLEFQKLVKVMETRHKEHLNMVQNALNENRILRLRLKEQDNGKAE